MDPWKLLGIAPTADVAAIRRAYARQLKLTRPDEDAAGFQRLVSARDAALSDAAMTANPAPDEDTAEHDIAPVLAVADRADAISASPRDPAEPAQADLPPIVIREVVEPAATPASRPIPLIVVTDGNGDAPHRDGFWLEASERHWALARELASDAQRLLSSVRGPSEELTRLIDASAIFRAGRARKSKPPSSREPAVTCVCRTAASIAFASSRCARFSGTARRCSAGCATTGSFTRSSGRATPRPFA